ncbi:unnamed protein product [Prorocentrum cordatum]|uniref:Uncharacterized protein n=1 Tax=Prorocentrum cordatum TaxID=2364126 RepID=A0ABN9QUW9_9DINO|nr:unnamed protein product [Polarella glacialis]
MDMALTFLTWAGDSEGASMPMSSDGLSWSSLVSGEASSLDRESITTQSYSDTATMTREGMKRYACRTSLIINRTLTKLQDPILIDECSSLVTDLALFVGDAYPALYDEVQVYNIVSDPTEQENLERF